MSHALAIVVQWAILVASFVGCSIVLDIWRDRRKNKRRWNE